MPAFRKLLPALLILVGSAAHGQELLKVHIISGSKSYQSEPSLREFKKHLEEQYRVQCTASWGKDGATMLDDLESLASAELMIVFARRLNLPDERMALIRQHWEKGKAIIGIRTASHAFQKEDNAVFDRQVLGGSYGSYSGKEFDVANRAAAADHPVLRGVGAITSRTMYTSGKLAKDAVVLQVGTRDQPVTWVHAYKGGRVFYTSLGVPEDFKDEDFRRLLTNAVFWTTRREPEKMKK